MAAWISVMKVATGRRVESVTFPLRSCVDPNLNRCIFEAPMSISRSRDSENVVEPFSST